MTNAGIGPSTRVMPAFVRLGAVLAVLMGCEPGQCPVTHSEGARVSQHAFAASFDPAAGGTLVAWGEDSLDGIYPHVELQLGVLEASGTFDEAPDPETAANPVASYGTDGGHLLLLYRRGWVVVDSSGRIVSTVPLRWPGDAWAVQGVPGGFLVAMNSGEPDFEIEVYEVDLDGATALRSRLGVGPGAELGATRIGDKVWVAYQVSDDTQVGVGAVRLDLHGSVVDRFFIPGLVFGSIAGAGDRGLLAGDTIDGAETGVMMWLDANGVGDRAPFNGSVSFGFAGLGYLVGRDWVDEDGNYVATIVRTEAFAPTAASVIALWSQATSTAGGTESWITATEIPFGLTDGTTTSLPAARITTRTGTVGCLE